MKESVDIKSLNNNSAQREKIVKDALNTGVDPSLVFNLLERLEKQEKRASVTREEIVNLIQHLNSDNVTLLKNIIKFSETLKGEILKDKQDFIDSICATKNTGLISANPAAEYYIKHYDSKKNDNQKNEFWTKEERDYISGFMELPKNIDAHKNWVLTGAIEGAPKEHFDNLQQAPKSEKKAELPPINQALEDQISSKLRQALESDLINNPNRISREQVFSKIDDQYDEYSFRRKPGQKTSNEEKSQQASSELSPENTLAEVKSIDNYINKNIDLMMKNKSPFPSEGECNPTQLIENISTISKGKVVQENSTVFQGLVDKIVNGLKKIGIDLEKSLGVSLSLGGQTQKLKEGLQQIVGKKPFSPNDIREPQEEREQNASIKIGGPK